jgi:hypothetical protein
LKEHEEQEGDDSKQRHNESREVRSKVILNFRVDLDEFLVIFYGGDQRVFVYGKVEAVGAVSHFFAQDFDVFCESHHGDDCQKLKRSVSETNDEIVTEVDDEKDVIEWSDGSKVVQNGYYEFEWAETKTL